MTSAAFRSRPRSLSPSSRIATIARPAASSSSTRRATIPSPPDSSNRIGQFAAQERKMTYVVTESCINCKHTDCVDVCPVDCFVEGPNFLAIDPDTCIDCSLCVAECPVEAIFAEDDVPADQRDFTALNAELAKVWKPIVERKPAPADADEWKEVKEKRQLIEK